MGADNGEEVASFTDTCADTSWCKISLDTDILRKVLPTQKGKKIAFAIKATDSNSNEALYSMDSDIPPTFVTEYKPTWGTTDAPTECISNWKECDNDAGSSICCNDGYDCYAKKSTYSQCRTSCPSSWTADGSCNNTDDAVDAASTTIIILVIVLVVIVGAGAFYYYRKHEAQKLHDDRESTVGPTASKSKKTIVDKGDYDSVPQTNKSVEMTNKKPKVELKAAVNPVTELSDLVGCWTVSGVPTEILPMDEVEHTFQVYFKGKHYGNRYDLTDGPVNIERNDGRIVDKAHSELGVSIVWTCKDSTQEPVIWAKNEGAVPTKTGPPSARELVAAPPPAEDVTEQL